MTASSLKPDADGMKQKGSKQIDDHTMGQGGEHDFWGSNVQGSHQPLLQGLQLKIMPDGVDGLWSPEGWLLRGVAHARPQQPPLERRIQRPRLGPQRSAAPCAGIPDGHSMQPSTGRDETKGNVAPDSPRKLTKASRPPCLSPLDSHSHWARLGLQQCAAPCAGTADSHSTHAWHIPAQGETRQRGAVCLIHPRCSRELRDRSCAHYVTVWSATCVNWLRDMPQLAWASTCRHCGPAHPILLLHAEGLTVKTVLSTRSCQQTGAMKPNPPPPPLRAGVSSSPNVCLNGALAS